DMLARELFVDASYLIALAVPADRHHARAIALMRELETAPRMYVTTQAVPLEVGDALYRPAHRASACGLLKALESDPRMQIVPISESLLGRGLTLFRERPDKEWGLTDCVSFVVMNDLGLTQALTTDVHFEQAGFRALLRECPA
ncbi:MAG: PIN domain-containing protein, partial [Verrucomicrobiales bacterium]|nr:PIN domain-containing protein [Verrucomicrobiales bacterium]